MDAKAKTAQQANPPIQKRDTCYFYDHEPLKSEESKDQKNFEAKKNYHSPATNSNNGSENGGQQGQALGRSYKKNFCVNKRGKQGQSSSILVIGSNVTVVKKNKKQDDGNMS